MLANKVSPASLCSNTNASDPNMNLAGHSLTIGCSGVEESQQSQASLFNSGNELANSMELFSQPYSASSHSSISQHSQTHNINTHTGAQNSQEDGRGVQNVRPDTFSGNHQPQSSGGHNKYYMRYLSAVSLSKLYKRQDVCAVSSTPLAGEGTHGDTVHSKAAFETWKSKQQERLEKQQLIEDTIKSTSSHTTKELNQTLENIRKEIKEALSSSGTNAIEKSQPEVLTDRVVNQILQSQTEIKEQLVDLKTLCSQQKAEIAALQMQVSALERTHTSTLQSTFSNEMTKLENALLKPFLHEFKVQVSQLSEQMRHAHTSSVPVSREEDSGLGGTQADCTSYLSTPTAASTHGHHNVASNNQKSGNKGVQNKRKQKKSSVTNDDFSRTLSTKRDSCSKPEHNNIRGVEMLSSQNSTEGLSTPCDIDLTQHSPSGCISQSKHALHQLKPPHYTGHQEGNRETIQAQTTANLSPLYVPVAKRKRPTGRVSRQSVTSRGRASATPRVTRRSNRLRKPTQKALPPEPLTQKEAESSDEDVQSLKQNTVDRQSSVAVQCNSSDRSGDVLDDWLDFRPPQPTPDSTDTKPTSQGRFQRSSEAAKRRLVVTEQMSSALAGSDSVLRELFLSAPSVFSP